MPRGSDLRDNSQYRGDPTQPIEGRTHPARSVYRGGANLCVANDSLPLFAGITGSHVDGGIFPTDCLAKSVAKPARAGIRIVPRMPKQMICERRQADWRLKHHES